MKAPELMKNRGEVVASIKKAQLFFKEEPSKIASAVKRPALESILLSYVKRFRNETPVSETKNAFVSMQCSACGGSGAYIFDNGSRGTCFRCKGKGHQDDSDQKRNYGYDLNNRPVVTTAAQIAEAIGGTVISLEDDIEF